MKKIAHLTAVAALVWASAAISENAGGAVYDAVADFNATGLQAPGDTWTYGAVTTLGGALSYLPKLSELLGTPEAVVTSRRRMARPAFPRSGRNRIA